MSMSRISARDDDEGVENEHDKTFVTNMPQTKTELDMMSMESADF